MDTVALPTSVTASAVASPAARDAFRGIWTFVGGFELELEGGGGEAALDAGEEVAMKQSGDITLSNRLSEGLTFDSEPTSCRKAEEMPQRGGPWRSQRT